jgi:hypothetical protein
MTASPTDLDEARNRNRPRTEAGLREAALQLLADGLAPADVAHALRVPEIVVREWQGQPDGTGP